MPDIQLLKRRPGSSILQSIDEAADSPLVSSIHGTQAARSLWNDAAATSVNLGAGANVATMQVGVATTTVSVPGNLTVAGTVTTISSANLVVNDPLIYANSGGLDPSFAGLAWDQGAALDVILVWNPTNSRIEVGRFNTVGGTVVPAATLTTLADFRADDLSLAGTGTGITFDGIGQVTSPGSLLLTSATGVILGTSVAVSAIQFQINSATVWQVANPGHLTTNADNTLDIGASAGSRPRTVYAGTSVVVGSSVTITTNAVTGSGALTVAAGAASLLQLNGPGNINMDAPNYNFAISGTFTWSINSSGHLFPQAAVDNTKDIGLSGTNRVRSIYAGTSVDVRDAAGTTGVLLQQSTGNITLYRSAGTASISVPSDSLLIQVTTAAKSISIDSAGAGGTVSVTAAGAMSFQSSGGTVTVGPVSAHDLTLQARTTSITLNDASNTSLSGFTATSIIGALDELKAGGSTGTASSFTNGEAGTINTGQVVYLDTAVRTVKLADATNSGGAFAGNITQAIAFAEAAVLTTATGSFATNGRANAAFIAGLTLNEGDEVFLAKTAGYLTNDVTGYVTGDVVRSMGFVSDATAYAGVLGDLAEIEIIHGPVAVV